ncbi:326_t:CDS:2 [Diversispora eburnea]|uniref:326_t:CDS:1 n=1 Tax=Diversispora eburnea TaxID=1213867 RepID=A0A9N9F4G1_9GLOM|nr:326_t:CDS:2 [Diversispora eburnea]
MLSSSYTPSYYRWIILFGFSLLTFSSASLWITFAPCLYIFMKYYSITATHVNILSTVYMIIYPMILFPSIKFFDKYGIRNGIIFGAFLNTLGSLIRFLGSLSQTMSGYWMIFIGQSIAAIAQVFMLGIPPKLANIWFNEFGEQNFATSIGVTANNAGIAVGFLLSPWLIKEETFKYDIPKYLLLQFGFCSLIYLFLVFTFKSAPGSFHKPFLLLSISYGMVTGGQYALSTLLAQLILPSTVGFLGFMLVISGMIGSLIVGAYLDYTLAYKKSCHEVVDEITSTGILNSFAQIWGILLISLMDSMENLNNNTKFPMELSTWFLFVIVFGGESDIDFIEEILVD